MVDNNNRRGGTVMLINLCVFSLSYSGLLHVLGVAKHSIITVSSLVCTEVWVLRVCNRAICSFHFSISVVRKRLTAITSGGGGSTVILINYHVSTFNCTARLVGNH